MTNNIFNTADIIIPKNTDPTAFSVVACDQYTSEPKYWEQVREASKGKITALDMIFPEIYLKTADFKNTIESINKSMENYLSSGMLETLSNSVIYVERKLRNGAVRKGVVGVVDLHCYDYSVGSQSLIRATEGTVLDRLPPRVQIRKDAMLELPHVMLLIDDPDRTVIEPLADAKADFAKVYDLPLMMNSGSLTGYSLSKTAIDNVDNALNRLADKDAFNKRYNLTDKNVLLFAVGDGNHSLATARQCYLNLVAEIGEEKASQSPARYALVEVVNLHDSSLEFEAIHRVVFDVDPDNMLAELAKYYTISDSPVENAQKITIVVGEQVKDLYILNPSLNLAVGSLQLFIDSYLEKNSGEVDYIHGDDVVKSLCNEHKNSVGFILPSMHKNELFKTVILDGALPRKTFSMGEACDKRFYYEARKIK